MLTFIVLLVMGLVIAFFAGQNTIPVTIFLSDYQFTFPLYTIIIGAMLIGFVVSWIVNLFESVFRMFVLQGKENIIKDDKKRFARLHERIHTLEIENARLKGENKEPVIVEEHPEPLYKPSFFHRLTHSFR